MRWSMLIPIGMLVCGGGELAATADDLVEADRAFANEMVARGVDAWVEALSDALGDTPGQWERRTADDSGGAQTSKGSYVTVWRRDPASEQAGVLDPGTEGE